MERIDGVSPVPLMQILEEYKNIIRILWRNMEIFL